MRTLYLDTEFTSLTLDRRLISLALVADDESEFYVELLDGWSEADCSEFTRTTVLPQLRLDQHGATREAASAMLWQFLAGQGPVEIAGDALRWDWPLLIELAGSAGLPANVLGCREVEPAANVDEIDLNDVPHHALLDARLICRLAKKQT